MAQVKPPPGARLDGSSQLASGLVGCWLLNEGAGTKVFDISGRRNHGTMTGMASPATTNASGWTGSPLGKSVGFDGTNDYIDTSQMPEIQGVSAVSMTAWFVLRSTPNYAGIIAKSNAGTTNRVGLSLGGPGFGSSTGLLMLIGNGSASTYGYTAGSLLTIGRWYFGAMVFDGTQATDATKGKVYLDGKQLTLTIPNALPTTTATHTESLRIGAASTNYMPGMIAHARVYNRALSHAEVSKLYRDPYAGISFDNWKRKRIYTLTAAAAANYGRGFFGFM